MVIMPGPLSTGPPPDTLMASPRSSARRLPPAHAAAGAPMGRTAAVGAVVRDEHHARVPGEGREGHADGREEIVADGDVAPRRERERAAGEPGEDPLLLVVQWFEGHRLLE